MDKPPIIVVDRESNWRRFAEAVLNEDGYEVKTMDDLKNMRRGGK